jgi:ribosomal protein S18 acetylase RimI-like enzyme
VEIVGPFHLFVPRSVPWSYYARPRPLGRPPTPADVAAVRRRQRTLGLPETFEWIADLVPELAAIAEPAGLHFSPLPLMFLDCAGLQPVSVAAAVRVVQPSEPVLARVQETVRIGFGGGPVSGRRPRLRAVRWLLATGRQVLVAAFVDGAPVCAGTLVPVSDVAEIVGVATLPSFRRQGFAAAVTTVLVGEAVRRGVRTVCLSAGSDDVARVYARVGFRRVGTVCQAEPADQPGAWAP